MSDSESSDEMWKPLDVRALLRAPLSSLSAALERCNFDQTLSGLEFALTHASYTHGRPARLNWEAVTGLSHADGKDYTLVTMYRNGLLTPTSTVRELLDLVADNRFCSGSQCNSLIDDTDYVWLTCKCGAEFCEGCHDFTRPKCIQSCRCCMPDL